MGSLPTCDAAIRYKSQSAPLGVCALGSQVKLVRLILAAHALSQSGRTLIGKTDEMQIPVFLTQLGSASVVVQGVIRLIPQARLFCRKQRLAHGKVGRTASGPFAKFFPCRGSYL